MKKLFVGIMAVAALCFGMSVYAGTPKESKKAEQSECCKSGDKKECSKKQRGQEGQGCENPAIAAFKSIELTAEQQEKIKEIFQPAEPPAPAEGDFKPGERPEGNPPADFKPGERPEGGRGDFRPGEGPGRGGFAQQCDSVRLAKLQQVKAVLTTDQYIKYLENLVSQPTVGRDGGRQGRPGRGPRGERPAAPAEESQK